MRLKVALSRPISSPEVFEVGREIANDAQACGDVVGIPEILRSDSRLVVEITIALLPVDAETNPERICERHVQHGLHAPQVVITNRTFDIAFKLLGRLLGHQNDRAAGGVAAEQRALGSFEHLHVLQVEEIARPRTVAAGRAGRRTERDHIAEIDADGRCGRLQHAEASDHEGSLVRPEAVVRRKGRSVCREFGCGRDVAIVELLLVEDGDRDRNVLQPLLDAAGRDDDCVVVLGRWCALGEYRCCDTRCQCRRCKQYESVS